MTTPAPAPTATLTAPAKPDPAAALWRSLCALATVVDPRLTPDYIAQDPGAVINVAHCHGGGDPADMPIITKWLETR